VADGGTPAPTGSRTGTGARRNFALGGQWRGRQYATKQVEAYAVEEAGRQATTVIVRYF